MKVLVAARVPGTDAHEVIQAHRLYLLELMQQWTRLKEGEARDDVGLALVVDAELFRLDAVIRWLDAADVRLARAAAEPPGPPPPPLRFRSFAGWGPGDEPAGTRPDGHSAVSVLELRGVSKTYGQEPARVHALAGVDLSVQAGEMVAVMGPSGSGKSTLLTIAGSLEDPTSGEVLVCGMALAGMPQGRKARLRRRVIGYVFQDFNLLPGLTAVENAALPLELDGVAVPKARAAGLAALETLGVAGGAGRFPDQLSGGERQRVAIARAVVGDRRLLLADEPSGALDSVNAGEVMRLLHEACQRGVAAVVVTHDAQLAAWADRVVLLRDGRVTGQTTRPPGPESLLMPREIR